MKRTLPVAQIPPIFRRALATHHPKTSALPQNYRILYGLMAPFSMMILNLSMFNVAIPTIRGSFQIQNDVVAWLITAYTLPFMVMMPLYGRLGDELGKRRLFVLGIGIFVIGTVVTALATTFSGLIIGRTIQGIGSASISPLCMAIISQIFPQAERGKALGTWNSMGPITGVIAPLTAGFLIDYLSWRMIFGPILIMSIIALVVIIALVPARQEPIKWKILTSFDWGGVTLLILMMVSLTCYLSSQTITGLAPLQDWRLLATTLILIAGFILWEQRHPKPYVNLAIFKNGTFSRAASCSGIRMFIMTGISFITTLYVTDIHQFTASATGTLFMLHAGAILLLMRLGGQFADHWGSRRVVTTGTIGQMVSMLVLALLPATAPVWLIVGLIFFHGVNAGCTLAPLHRAALDTVPDHEIGSAAGVYSMIRFSGILLGPVINGVLLQQLLDYGLPTITAYQICYSVVVCVAGVGVYLARGIKA